MTSMVRSAVDTRLVVVSEPGLVGGNRIGVPGAELPAESTGLLLPSPVDPASARAVRLFPVGALPPGVIAVPDQLARAAGLLDTYRDTWRLQETPATTAASAVLEPQTDETVEAALQRLRASTELAGQVLTVPPDLDAGAVWLEVEGDPYRLRAATAADGTPLRGLVRIDTTTSLSLFVPAGRSGVDIVVLADCSGSMSWNDVLETSDAMPGGSAKNPYTTRMRALKKALRQMADARARVRGRQARVALVRFTTTSACVFPPQEGMVDLADGGDARLLDEFRQAIAVLDAEEAGTDIGQALQYASELLYRHGAPHNDRMIVLVSDGATWSEKGMEATGEMLLASEDPVSLLEEFHDSLKVRLHAVGIGDERTFAAWWNTHHRARHGDPHVSIVPNHQLLRRLVQVGGGDPTRIGGMDVLEEYFSGLGRGVTRLIGHPARARLPAPQSELARAAAPDPTAPDPGTLEQLSRLADRVSGLYADCITVSKRRVGRPLYRTGDDSLRLLRIGAPVQDIRAFDSWIAQVWKIFHEGQESCLNEAPPPKRPYEVPGIHDLVWDGRLGQIPNLRKYTAHMLRRGNENHERALQLEIGRIFTRHTGRYHVEDEDRRGWCALQIGLLEDLSSLLNDIYTCLNTPEPSQPPGSADPSAAPGPAAGAGPTPSDDTFVSMGWP